MRALVIIFAIFGWVPVLLFKPHVGVLVWNWVSNMIPHTTTYQTRGMPILDVIAALTIIGLFISKEPRKLPIDPIIILMLLFFLWGIICVIFALDPTHSLDKFIQFFKVILFVVISAIVIQSPNRLKAYYWVLALSLGFFAIKGGLFTIVTAGGARVQGPGGQFTDNNQFALALSMMIPVAYYLYLHPPMKILKWPMFGSIFLTFLSVVGTNSRGGLMAGLAVMGMLYLNMKKGKLLVLAILIPGAIAGWQVLPENTKVKYLGIMDAVGIGQSDTSDEKGGDSSFYGRVVMWKYAVNVANDRPLVGGGYNIHYHPNYKDIYMPVDHKIMAWHSIYFEVLGEMGYVGLFLFLMIIFTAWYAGGTTYQRLKDHKDLLWLADMAYTLRLSLVGFCVAGLTVNVFSIGVMYNMCMMIALCSIIGNKILATRTLQKTAFNPYAVQNQADVHKDQYMDPAAETKKDNSDPFGLKKLRLLKRKKQKWTPHDKD